MQSRKHRRPRRTRAQWLSLVDQQTESGLSAKAFCEREALAYKSFIRWRSKRNTAEACKGGEFIELTPTLLPTPTPAVKAAPDDCVMELRVGGSVTVRIYARS